MMELVCLVRLKTIVEVSASLNLNFLDFLDIRSNLQTLIIGTLTKRRGRGVHFFPNRIIQSRI